MQLGLSAHLLDIGFDDRWCAQNLGHRVAKSLAYAHATGLGYEGPEIELLAAVLTPYWKWNSLSQIQAKENGTKPKDGPFSREAICCLTRALLDRGRYVPGHPRPAWWGTQSGRRSCRERVCQYGEIPGGGVDLKKKKKEEQRNVEKRK